ncbi:MAG: alpha-L-fucosidase [Eubacteriales bacterium]|nr:alpha-L-fucosidase [Eubacteriales bacterium]
MSDKKERTQWLADRKWGVFAHYLAAAASSTDDGTMSPKEWNEKVNSFDVEAYADTLAYVGAGYMMITLGQNTGHWCCPNPVWDKYVGRTPSRCSERDLPMELADALHKRGIAFGVYMPGHTPMHDELAYERIPYKHPVLGGATFDAAYVEGVRRYCEFVSWWGEHYGKKVEMMWVDGVLRTQPSATKPELTKQLMDAYRAGNPERLVAMNLAILVQPLPFPATGEDMTAGETDFIFDLPGHDWKGDYSYWPVKGGDGLIGGERLHQLAIAGDWWGQGKAPRFNDDFFIGYTQAINDCGGIISWDIPHGFDGRIPEPFVRQLRALGEATNLLR